MTNGPFTTFFLCHSGARETPLFIKSFLYLSEVELEVRTLIALEFSTKRKMRVCNLFCLLVSHFDGITFFVRKQSDIYQMWKVALLLIDRLRLESNEAFAPPIHPRPHVFEIVKRQETRKVVVAFYHLFASFLLLKCDVAFLWPIKCLFIFFGMIVTYYCIAAVL